MLAKKLQKWDTIGIITPSKYCDNERVALVENFIIYIKSLGLNVTLAPNFQKVDAYGISWGSVEERVRDFHDMLKDQDIDVIWCLQGGDTVNQILDYIDFDLVKQYPKIIIWKSDIDVLLLAIYSQTRQYWFHGCDSKIWNDREMDFQYTKDSFIIRFFEWDKNIFTSWETTRYVVRKWQASWIALGCNLVSLLKLAGTNYFPSFTGAVFFMETYKSNTRTLLFQLAQLKQMWCFDDLRGLVIWSNYWFEWNDQDVERIILDELKEYDFPIMKTNEFGHYQPHAFIPIWAEVYMNTETKTLKIISDFLC